MLKGFPPFPWGFGIEDVILGPRNTAPECGTPAARAHVNSPGSEGRRRGGGQGSPWLLPINSSEAGSAAATLRAPGSVSQEVGVGRPRRERVASPLSLLCSGPATLQAQVLAPILSHSQPQRLVWQRSGSGSTLPVALRPKP